MQTTSKLQAPKVAVGALTVDKNRILLVKRGTAPSKGLWAIPGGKIELGETMVQAVEREVLEETGIAIETSHIISVFDSITRDDTGVIQFHYIIIDFLAHPLDPKATPASGDDAEDARWVSVDELDNLPITKTTLELIKSKF